MSTETNEPPSSSSSKPEQTKYLTITFLTQAIRWKLSKKAEALYHEVASRLDSTIIRVEREITDDESEYGERKKVWDAEELTQEEYDNRAIQRAEAASIARRNGLLSLPEHEVDVEDPMTIYGAELRKIVLTDITNFWQEPREEDLVAPASERSGGESSTGNQGAASSPTGAA